MCHYLVNIYHIVLLKRKIKKNLILVNIEINVLKPKINRDYF
jgi:hypothetical protein